MIDWLIFTLYNRTDRPTKIDWCRLRFPACSPHPALVNLAHFSSPRAAITARGRNKYSMWVMSRSPFRAFQMSRSSKERRTPCHRAISRPQLPSDFPPARSEPTSSDSIPSSVYSQAVPFRTGFHGPKIPIRLHVQADRRSGVGTPRRLVWWRPPLLQQGQRTQRTLSAFPW